MKKAGFFILLICLWTGVKAQKYSLSSPGQKLSAEVELNQGIAVKLFSGTREMVSLSG